MKFTLSICLFFLMSFFVNAQEFHGEAEYFSKKITKQKSLKTEASKNEKADPEFEKALEQAMKKASEKQYLLTFNKTECLYEEEKKLEKPDARSSGVSISVSFSGDGKKYINAKEKIGIQEDEIFGKEFLIVDPIEKPDWKLLNETKMIGEYNCFKAELIVPVTDKQNQLYKEYLKKEEIKPTLFKMSKPEDKIVTAWYTPEIAVSFGPSNYWGLPGLILEINDGNHIILCSKVKLSNKIGTKIKVPNVGEKVTQKKFDEIQKKKMDSMKDKDGNIIFSTSN